MYLVVVKVGRQSKSGVVKIGIEGAVAKSGSGAGRYNVLATITIVLLHAVGVRVR